MSFIESCFIQPAEYRRRLEQRLLVPEQVDEESIFSLCLSLSEMRAAKTPVKFEEDLEFDQKSGIYTAGAEFLDLDLAVVLRTTLHFDTNSMLVNNSNLAFDKYRALGGYLLTYGDGLTDLIQAPELVEMSALDQKI